MPNVIHFARKEVEIAVFICRHPNVYIYQFAPKGKEGKNLCSIFSLSYARQFVAGRFFLDCDAHIHTHSFIILYSFPCKLDYDDSGGWGTTIKVTPRKEIITLMTQIQTDLRAHRHLFLMTLS